MNWQKLFSEQVSKTKSDKIICMEFYTDHYGIDTRNKIVLIEHIARDLEDFVLLKNDVVPRIIHKDDENVDFLLRRYK